MTIHSVVMSVEKGMEEGGEWAISLNLFCIKVQMSNLESLNKV